MSTLHNPLFVPQVMVSSTFTDLKEHRNALIQAISKHDMHPVGMEFSDAKLTGDVVDASLAMVAKSAAYILIIGRKYGQTPECPKRNPEKLSVTELEYREAVLLKRPVLLFLMGEDHSRKESEIELDPEKRTKLAAFRELAKKSAPDSAVNRVYGTFESLEQLKEIIGAPLSEMQHHLEPKASAGPPPSTEALPCDALSTLPKPPALYAEPDYIGSHRFVGRRAELDTLSEWASASDPTNLLLFEAIGGNGKSMLTWEWTTKHATKVRSDWAGRFWYSFYERGAIMQDFCQRALAYMTGRPLKEFEKRKTAELKDELIAKLHSRPWLLVLDGLERVLVAYHRIDAAEVPDEDANAPTDKILNRNPCDAIRDEDSDLLRALAACSPSKILISSRLTPRVLLNPARQTIPGARSISLLGLRPPDAEDLLSQCGVNGDSTAIQDYLEQNCGNHPLVIGVLGGLIANYMPDRGNFDTWCVDLDGGAALDLAKLNLIQRRNHILEAAINALSNASRQLLSTLALVSEAVDYKTLEALYSKSSIEPKELMATSRSSKTQKRSEGHSESQNKLTETVLDLERRGLLQYDPHERRYDLHPVVRGVAAGGIGTADKRRYGMRVVDHFSSLSHSSYEEAKTLDDLSSGLHVVRTLLKLGYLQRAAFTCVDGLLSSLCFSLEAHAELLSLLRPFFTKSWDEIPTGISVSEASNLANYAAIALSYSGEFQKALIAYEAALRADLETRNWQKVIIRLSNISINLTDQNRLAKGLSIAELAYELALARGNEQEMSKIEFELFAQKSRVGQSHSAETTWRAFDLMGRNWSRESHREGEAEYSLALSSFWQRTLQESQLSSAKSIAQMKGDRNALRGLHRLGGSWRLEQLDFPLAITSFQDAVRMARERRLVDAESETGLALAKFHLSQLSGDHAYSEAERLAQLRQPAHRYLAMLWLAIGDLEQAEYHVLAAYRWAWADGEPFVHRYELKKTTELLQQINVPVPGLQPYDQAKDVHFPWEADVRAAIEKLKAEKEAKKKTAKAE